MNYEELKEEEQQELQSSLYADVVWGGERFGDLLSKKDKRVVLKKADWCGGNIPLKIMKKVFGHYDFVKDDFFCNQK